MTDQHTAPATDRPLSPQPPEPAKRSLPWWGWAIIALLALVLAVGITWFIARETGGESDAGPAPAPAAVEEDAQEDSGAEPAEEAEAPAVQREEFTGTGDLVIPIDIPAAAVVSFTCEYCTSSILVTSDGDDSLLVNHIGAYTGTQLVNMREGSVITEITVEADADWELIVDDVTSAPSSDEPVTGTGDQVFWMTGEFTSAIFTHDGPLGRNWALYAYRNGDSNALVRNGIGSRDEGEPAVEMFGPALVEVLAKGTWSVTPQ